MWIRTRVATGPRPIAARWPTARVVATPGHRAGPGRESRSASGRQAAPPTVRLRLPATSRSRGRCPNIRIQSPHSRRSTAAYGPSRHCRAHCGARYRARRVRHARPGATAHSHRRRVCPRGGSLRMHRRGNCGPPMRSRWDRPHLCQPHRWKELHHGKCQPHRRLLRDSPEGWCEALIWPRDAAAPAAEARRRPTRAASLSHAAAATPPMASPPMASPPGALGNRYSKRSADIPRYAALAAAAEVGRRAPASPTAMVPARRCRAPPQMDRIVVGGGIHLARVRRPERATEPQRLHGEARRSPRL